MEFSQIRELSPGYVVIGSQESRPLGFMLFAPCEITPYRLHLENIHVNRGTRGLQIGSTLLAYLDSLAKKEGYKEIVGSFVPEFGNKNIRVFYEKHGYIVDGNTIAKLLASD